MKRTLSLVLSLIMIIGMFSGLNLTAYAESTNNDSNDSSFPYSDSDVYAADSIIKGIIDKEGVAHGSSEISMALLHNYTYHNISEALIDDGALVFDSVFWQNLKSTLSGDFVNIVNWQEEMYVLLIIDYLNYYSQSSEFESNFEKNTVKFTEDIYKAVIKYANNEYLDNVDDLIKNQSLSDAVSLSNKWGVVNKLNKYNYVLGDIETVSNTAVDYYKNLSKALSVQKADESRIEFLKQMKKAGSDNYYFVTAVNNVISMYESSYSSLVFAESSKTMLKHGMSVLFSEAKKACPEAAAIIDGLKIYTEGLNWLFNSDDISKNNLKLIIVYTIGSYASSAVRSLRDTYSSNPNEENANAFINGYIGYLKYQEYASNNTIGFVSSALFDGIVNQIKNIFSDENKATYNEFKEYFNNDINFCEKLEELIKKHYDLYFAIVGYNSTVLTDNNNLTDNLTPIDSSNIYSDELTYNFLISGQSVITRDLILTDNLTICGDLYLNGGTLGLNGYTLTVYGNLIQSGGGMSIDEGTLNIGGDYRIQTILSNGDAADSSGYLQMTNNADLINIKGDFITQSSRSLGSGWNNLTAGTMKIGGNFYQYNGNNSNFSASGSHMVIFEGDYEHIIHLDSTDSGFYKIKTSDKSSVAFDNGINNLTLYNNLTINGDAEIKGTLNLNGYTLTVNGNLNTNNYTHIKKGHLIVNGDLKSNDYYFYCDGGTVDVKGSLLQNSSISLAGGIINISGNLTQVSGYMDLGGGTLNVGGDYRIQTILSNGDVADSSGYLQMTNNADLINVKGNFITQSSRSLGSGWNNLTAGTMKIGGNFYQYNGNNYNFSASGTHLVVLNGSNTQLVHFDSTNSHFNYLELTKDKTTGYVFDPDNCWNKLITKEDINSVKIYSQSTTVKQGDNLQFISKINGSNISTADVTWSISGNTDSNTVISDKGILSVSLNEKAKQITVTATSVADKTKSASVTITIGEIVPVINGIAITPPVVSTVCGQSCQFNAVVFGFYNPSQSVIWSISGNKSSNTKIDSNGLLTIADNETSKQITVKAVLSADKTITASVTVDIMQIKIISTVDNVTVTMETGETQQLKAVVTGTNNPSQKVVWSVSGNKSKNTVINDNGEITIGEDETSSLIIVKATSVDDSSKYGEFAINISTNDEPANLAGDVNGDGGVTIDDVTLIQKYLASMVELDSKQIKAADVTGDGDVSIDDVTKIQKFIAGLVSSLSSV